MGQHYTYDRLIACAMELFAKAGLAPEIPPRMEPPWEKYGVSPPAPVQEHWDGIHGNHPGPHADQQGVLI